MLLGRSKSFDPESELEIYFNILIQLKTEKKITFYIFTTPYSNQSILLKSFSKLRFVLKETINLLKLTIAYTPIILKYIIKLICLDCVYFNDYKKMWPKCSSSSVLPL